jgi:CRP-like cAMP-binding protein
MTDQKFSSLMVNQPKWIENKQQKIISKGAPTDRLLWIEEGKVRRVRDGRIYSKNSFLEILGFFGSNFYTSNVISLTKTKIRVISRPDVMRLFELDEHPKLRELFVLLAREKLSAEEFQFSQVG